ncbi:sulfonate ABC transporter ATP-binding protein [Burkholderia sp. ST111]|jgi:ABC-type nitrate/sulfonate/bicarbonate transport system, ATPase component|uniref:Aliphatic sulfonates import ATP-binding protein SsuB n=1 Tax=Paraburkholderia nemoris TaxID=2793076 RepID=A0ABN7N3Z7_9BURK|nr:sulfonate ABC transporter ATP-binding protein [Burkholderia sp. ST111]MBK3815167.1 ABC transporter ATP-binding protein [Paraburkholderia aspalathi]CAE6772432.1 Aliphatic sulfonates import ATP-binding protein SsuB [Paraburkholderia nemoris]CAE6838503.1 Aliphatic sulfonates import ATP-binding protein SsuB [Paraburkholderia nemoris]CAE6852917.1 Aliphatic sulfonates import ATP-binding protein SsuB [Paraburkholderia nemoris]
MARYRERPVFLARCALNARDLSSQAPLLQVRAVSKRYEARAVLDRVTFGIRRGEIVSLVGPSGCGKSTLLRVLAGLDRDFEGEILLDELAQHGPSPRVGVIFQEPRLLPWLSVADNIAFSAGPRRGADPRVGQLLDEVGLAGTGAALPKQLSGGMAQRVALARGLFSQPDLLLLDEPFSAVDAMTRMRLQDLLLSLTRAHGTAALIVTHDLDEALYLSDRVLLLNTAGQRGARLVRDIDVAGPHPRDRRDTALAGVRSELLDGMGEARNAYA